MCKEIGINLRFKYMYSKLFINRLIHIPLYCKQFLPVFYIGWSRLPVCWVASALVLEVSPLERLPVSSLVRKSTFSLHLVVVVVARPEQLVLVVLVLLWKQSCNAFVAVLEVVCILVVCIPELQGVVRERKHACGRLVVVEVVHSGLEQVDHSYRMHLGDHRCSMEESTNSRVVPELASSILSSKLQVVAWSGNLSINFFNML